MDGTLRSQEKLYILNQVPLFAGLSLSDKKNIATMSSIVEYKKGDIIYKEGDPVDAFYCVITGRLKVYTTKHGREEDLEYLKRGRYFGIISLLTGEPHSASVQVINDAAVLKILKNDFDRLIRRVPALAINFSQTLSRRLKRKGLHEKRVFESTIISIFGGSDKARTSDYALNLAISLKIQTAKKVILLIVGNRGLRLSSLFLNENVIKNSLFTKFGIDIINILHLSDEAMHLTTLLSFLTSDYHFVLVDITIDMDKAVFESLRQSDIIHLVISSDEAPLHVASKLITELKNSSAGIANKISVITHDDKKARALPFNERKVILKHDIFATLSDIDEIGTNAHKSDVPIIMNEPECEYSRMIRRISRRLGDCLIGLALGSGAAQGLAHAGVLKVIEKNNIPIDVLAGTSMGALVGALWALGKKTAELETIAAQFKSRISVLRMMDVTFPAKGLIKGREMKRFLVSQLGDSTFYDLKLPFKIVACDIEKREEVVLTEGSLVDAIMASIAVPGMFEPVKIGERLLVDGGIINPLPTNVLMRDGVSKIIAVNTLPSPEDVQKSNKKALNIFDMIVKNIQASQYLLAEISCQNADIAMHPVLAEVDWYEFYEGERIMKRGEEEAIKYLPQLRELATTR